MNFPSPLGKYERIQELPFDYSAQPTERLNQCNLSGATDLITITHVDRYGYPQCADLSLSSGLVFLNPVMTREAYSDFYQGTYRPLVSAYHNRLIDAQNIQDEQLDYAKALAQFLSPEFTAKPPQQLMDVGGSTGVVARHLVETYGCEATILDPAPDELAMATGTGMKSIPGFIEDVTLEDGAYDFIMICQTIDHLLDVDGALATLRNAMSDDGLFYVDIVDFRAAYLRNHRVEEAVKVDHPYYFTHETMMAYLRKHGFEVLRMNFLADHLHVGYLCRKGEPQADFLPSREWIDEFIREIRWIQNTKHLAPAK
ncbi:MAG: class I SAM-dependent methyltransferase [Gammaproteobacteria bacterium]